MSFEINKDECGNFHFINNSYRTPNMKRVGCYYCLQVLDLCYLYILNKLKEKNLLPKNYRTLCCSCYKRIKELECIKNSKIEKLLISKTGVIKVDNAKSRFLLFPITNIMISGQENSEYFHENYIEPILDKLTKFAYEKLTEYYNKK